MTIFDTLESEVRSYSRAWPVVFDRASGSRLFAEDGRAYLDFFAGAGALNYGHNNPVLKKALLDYVARDGVTHALDMFTVARRELLEALDELVLKPRALEYKVIFPGPGGANAVEVALKLARKVTGRESVVNFTGAFHGMSLGALSVTDSSMTRNGAGASSLRTTTLPYGRWLDGACPDFPRLETLLGGHRNGRSTPGAVIVETVQGEGGVNAAGAEWLRGLAELCRRRGVLLIVDDVQMGCGRTGPFFSFEDAGLEPDVICLSKSIGAYGLPLALTLVRPELDIWEPGEHNGTFRGLNLAFVTATAALRTYWRDDALERSTRAKGERIGAVLGQLAARYPDTWLVAKGRGLARGLEFASGELAAQVGRAAFERGMLMETSGPDGEVVKLLPPLTIRDAEVEQGLAILAESVQSVLGR